MTGVLFVDIGATWVRAGLTSDEPSTRLPTPLHSDELVRVIEAAASSCSATAIAVGCPGIIDAEGTVRLSFLRAVNGYALGRELRHSTSLPVVVVNDVEAQALGAARGAAGRLTYISFGTRIGGAIVHDGRLPMRRLRAEGEFGHLSCGYTEAPSRCECGGDDCLDLALGGFRLAERLGSDWYRKPTANSKARELSRYFSRALRTLTVTTGPDRLVVAGWPGIYCDLREEIARELALTSWNIPIPDFELDTWASATLGLGQILAGTLSIEEESDEY